MGFKELDVRKKSGREENKRHRGLVKLWGKFSSESFPHYLQQSES